MESSDLLNKTKPSDFKIYGRLISYVLPYFPQFLISILGFAVFAGSQVAFAEWLKRVIDYVDNPSDDLRLIWPPLAKDANNAPNIVASCIFNHSISTLYEGYYTNFTTKNVLVNVSIFR